MAVQSLLKPQVKELLNKSIASELYASNLYKYLANQMQRLGLFGCQKYFLKESAEELTHYQEIVDYINDLGDIANMPQVDAISDMINGIGTALNLAYETEKVLLYQYVDIYEQVEDEMEDCITAQFLLKFIKLQRKSVGAYGDLISRLERNPTDVFMFDDYLGEK